MPKDRKKKRNTRPVKPRLFILCEGEKTETNYLKKLIDSYPLRGKPISVKVIQTKKIPIAPVLPLLKRWQIL